MGHPSAGFNSGFSVAAVDLTGDGRTEVVVGTGRGRGLRAEVRIVAPGTLAQVDDFFAFESPSSANAFVAAG